MYEPNNAVSNRLLGYFRALDQMGVEATVVFLHPDKYRHKIDEEYQHLKIEYYWSYLVPYRGVFRNLTLRKYIRKFISKLRKGDVVYTYGLSSINMLCKRVPGVRIYAERTENPEIVSSYPVKALALNPKEELDAYLNLDGLFVISESLRDYYINLGVQASKIKIINMFVDPHRFTSIKKTKTADRYIAYCGTASNNKDGVDELIKAFAIVAEKVLDVKLYIIGKTPLTEQKFDNYLLIKRLNLEDRVVFTGVVSAKEMPQLLVNADVLALDRPDNKQAKYGFPTKLGEYLLSGNPVVVTSVGDITKFLTDGVSALIARPQNPKNFADKLLWALTYTEEAICLGGRGKMIALEFFNSLTETQKLYSFMFPNNLDSK